MAADIFSQLFYIKSRKMLEKVKNLSKKENV